MRIAPLSFAVIVTAIPCHAQTYTGTVQRGQGETSVAYGQPVGYVQRLGPSRYYPPTRYGYVEGTGTLSAYRPRTAAR